ncbi:hypothetical protein F0267_01135 [Vibrio coralliilyticus]|uniref:Conjugal transfer protein TraE n=1 Tax=Vibrio coralliilyticus TaxID=190893 RepID=A0AAN0SI43_9VIBR|nr:MULTISPECIES: TraE/TraK family type IV conjugative transfer system protein [Vibrio]AIW22720.1 hypothetical protein IX92_27100 [Vibrio coralliilyticus]MCZ2798932.1 TraE/TraK family type IV conjugative transfer system protein [Vibrio alginolyticus]NOH36826.1 hypothetical protein [Vibrio coralliilyticus]
MSDKKSLLDIPALRKKIFSQSKVLKTYNKTISMGGHMGIAVVVMAVANIWLVSLVAKKEVTSIVTPPTFTEQISMRGNQVSESYQSMWAMFVAEMIGNISPSRMDIVLQTMQRMIPAKNWDEVKEQMTAQLARLKIRKVEEKFSVKDVTIDPVTKVVWVTGEKETTSIRTGRSVSEMWTFEVRIDSNGVGSPVITHLKQYAGAPQKKRRAKELQKELPVAEQSTEQATQG